MNTIITAIAPAIEDGVNAANATAAAEGTAIPFPLPEQGALDIQATKAVFPWDAQTAAQRSDAWQTTDAALQIVRAARRATDPTFS